MKQWRSYLLWIVLVSITGLAGCGGANWFLYLTEGDRTETIEAEFEIPKRSTVAVVIYTDVNTQFEYPSCRLTLGSQINARLREALPEKDGIRLIDARAVCRYQDENIYWDEKAKYEIAQDLKSDLLVFVSLMGYSLHQPGQPQLLQGHITAEVKVYNDDPDATEALWESDELLQVTYPDEIVYDARHRSRIRRETEKQFAELLVKKFHEHKERIKLKGEEE
jgi:hypothetical protein